MTVHLAAASAIVVLMLAVWAVSVARRDASLVDIGWGPGFVVVGAVAAVAGGGDLTRRLLVVALVGLWGARLGLYLARRNLGKGEDYRYQAMRRRAGEGFWWKSLYIVFGLQGAMMFVVSLPVQVSASAARAPGALAVAGVVVWAAGFAFEAVGDAQLRRFKADPSNAGKVMDRGLWRYTRHPNYFGDAVLWWGVWLVAAESPWGWATAIGPLVMTFLLTRISGVPMLERRMARSKPGYSEYMQRTSAFVPLPPKAA